MKTMTLCVVLLVTAWGLMAENPSPPQTSCRELVALVRPAPSEGEGEEGQRYLDSADKAYRDCRGANMPVEIRARALFKYGIASAARAREQAALSALREATALLDRPAGEHSALLIEILDYNAFLEGRMGMQSDAIDDAKRAIDIRTHVYGKSSPEVAEGMIHLAMVHLTFKEYTQSEALLRDAIRVAAQTCGPQCEILVDAYAGMEVLYETQGNQKEAKRYAELSQNAVPTGRSKD